MYIPTWLGITTKWAFTLSRVRTSTCMGCGQMDTSNFNNEQKVRESGYNNLQTKWNAWHCHNTCIDFHKKACKCLPHWHILPSYFYIHSYEQSAGLFDQPLVVEGKRRRKGIETFAITHEAKRPVLEYKGGTGIKLGDIAQGVVCFFLHWSVFFTCSFFI